MYAGVVLGGMGSIIGAFWGGMTIGLVQQLSTLVLPTQLQNTAIFVVFLLIIFFRPQGFFGRVPSGPEMDGRSLAPADARLRRGLCACSRLFVAEPLLPADDDAGPGVGRVRPVLEHAVSGYTGLVSFGHAAFFGLGAYTTALGQVHFGLSPWL